MTDLVERAKEDLEAYHSASIQQRTDKDHFNAELARAVIAADELAEALEDGLCNSGIPGFDSNRLDRALATYRKAVEGE